MLRFDAFESLGLTCACISEKSDGDFARGASAEDLAHFRGACGLAAADLALVRQVHRRGVAVVDAEGEPDCVGVRDLGEADALVGDASGVALGIRVADCVPVYLYDPENRAVGLVHAGRMGTLQGVVANAVRNMGSRYGAEPSALHALIGPSAGPCCYEVSVDMAKDFINKGLSVDGRHIDLWASNARQLVDCGVPASQIEQSEICTICDGRFHSHRAESNAGRNLALLAL